LRIGVPRVDQRSFFGDAECEAAFARDLAFIDGLGLRLVEFDFEPFAEVARLLYEGPWVAERYAATKPLIETHPEALYPVTRAIIEGAQKFDAVAAFEAYYKLADRKRRAERVWSDFDAMAVPTIPRPYTVAEVEADPVRLNSRLGTYTNFVNLLDLTAFATPSGMRADGLPSSVTLIAPSGADGLLAGLAAAIQARSGAPMGATGQAAPGAPPSAVQCPPGRIALAVVAAHLAGLPLNHELVELGGTFLREAKTTKDYRLFALPGAPRKPGLLRVADGAGATIEGEIWTLDPAAFGAFVARVPSPLSIGTIWLADGSSVKGFLVEAEAVAGAADISKYGGWRAYLASG
jgi:allophanate hydrolase